MRANRMATMDRGPPVGVEALPGSVQDKRAEWVWGVLDEFEAAGLVPHWPTRATAGAPREDPVPGEANKPESPKKPSCAAAPGAPDNSPRPSTPRRSGCSRATMRRGGQRGDGDPADGLYPAGLAPATVRTILPPRARSSMIRCARRRASGSTWLMTGRSPPRSSSPARRAHGRRADEHAVEGDVGVEQRSRSSSGVAIAAICPPGRSAAARPAPLPPTRSAIASTGPPASRRARTRHPRGCSRCRPRRPGRASARARAPARPIVTIPAAAAASWSRNSPTPPLAPSTSSRPPGGRPAGPAPGSRFPRPAAWPPRR